MEEEFSGQRPSNLTDPDGYDLHVLLLHTDEYLHLLHPQDKLAVKPCVPAAELYLPAVHVKHQGLLG